MAPTVGYLIGFPIGAVVIGMLMRSKRGYLWTLFSMFVGLTVIFACGTVGLYATYFHNIEQSIIGGFLIFSWWDLLKLSAAAGIYQQVARRYPKLPE
jgi:biotin transport system substrate-specific component